MDVKEFEFQMSKPFRSREMPGTRPAIPNKLMKILVRQAKEYDHRGIDYSTPRKWNEGFHTLGGGSFYRKSRAVTDKIDWEEFLKLLRNILKNKD